MRVMTYNMLHAPGDRLDALVEVIQDARPDVLACQEVDDISGLLELAYRLAMPPVIGHANRPESPPAPEHLAILSRWPIVESRVHPGDTEAMFRPVLEVWVQPPQGACVGFFTVHFRAGVGAPGSELKRREVAQLCSILSRTSGHYCALGDFNALAPGEGNVPADWRPDLPADYRAALLGGVIGELQALGLSDTWRQCNPPPAPVASTFRGRANSRIDYIWASPALGRLAQESVVLRTPHTEIASDHYPLLTVFDDDQTEN
jgi:endonuclease/exonuclease/phosphatase family metal-dependent hydrolase